MCYIFFSMLFRAFFDFFFRNNIHNLEISLLDFLLFICPFLPWGGILARSFVCTFVGLLIFLMDWYGYTIYDNNNILSYAMYLIGLFVCMYEASRHGSTRASTVQQPS